MVAFAVEHAVVGGRVDADGFEHVGVDGLEYCVGEFFEALADRGLGGSWILRHWG